MFIKSLGLKIWQWLPLPPNCRWNIAWLLRQKYRVAVAARDWEKGILVDEGCSSWLRSYFMAERGHTSVMLNKNARQ